MKLHDIVIPYSWYRISKEQGNNALIIENTVGTNIISYTLPDGNYSSLTEIASALGSGAFLVDGYSVTLVPHTKHICIEEANNFQIKLSAPGDDTRSLAWLLGFREKMDFETTKHIGEGILLIGEDIRYRYFYLVVDDYKSVDNFNVESMNRKKFVNGFILARLIIQIQDNTLSHIRFGEYTRIYDGPCDINKLDIKLIDEWGYVVNLNEMDMSLSLELTIKL